MHRDNDGKAKSSAFKTKSYCVHVVGRTRLEDVRARYPEDHLYEFSVGVALDAGATAVDDERIEGDDADHAIVTPSEVSKKESFAKKVMAVAIRVCRSRA